MYPPRATNSMNDPFSKKYTQSHKQSNKLEKNVNLFWWWGLSINFQCSKWQGFSLSISLYVEEEEEKEKIWRSEMKALKYTWRRVSPERQKEKIPYIFLRQFIDPYMSLYISSVYKNRMDIVLGGDSLLQSIDENRNM